MLDKDDILEALFDGLGVGDTEWRHRLSRAADEVFSRLAEQTAGAVLASFWRHPQIAGDSGTPTGWLSSLPGKIVEVHCICSPEIAAERFAERKRHDGHLDRDRNKEELAAAFVRLAAHGPLGVGPLVDVDTGRAVDLESVLRRLDLHTEGHKSCTEEIAESGGSSSREPVMTETATSLSGQTLRWKFEEGPTAGGTYEHTFEPDGSVVVSKLDGDAKGKPTREKKYSSFEVAPGIQLVSYLAESGYTLTVALNFATKNLYGFASNDKEWYPVSGTFETVK